MEPIAGEGEAAKANGPIRIYTVRIDRLGIRTRSVIATRSARVITSLLLSWGLAEDSSDAPKRTAPRRMFPSRQNTFWPGPTVEGGALGLAGHSVGGHDLVSGP